jgi:3-methylcrotonyl-CoA carboxylase alpha subunit
MGYEFELENGATSVHPIHSGNGTRDGGLFALSVDGRRIDVTLTPTTNDCEFRVDIDGVRESVYVASDADGHGDVHFIHFRGRSHRVIAINALERAQQKAAPTGGDEVLRAPMPGVVVELTTTIGSLVEAGELLLTIESMKLQTAIVAPNAGRVIEIGLSQGANFEQGAMLIRLEAIDDEPGEDVEQAGEDG